MAPEQTLERDLGPYTDVFGLGVLFYQMLTGGCLPYEVIEEANAFEVDKPRRVLDYSVEPIFPSEINHCVPDEIAEVALRAVSPDLRKRYASPEDFREALWEAVKAAEAIAPFQAVLTALRRPACGP
jgi:serine/threonine protein kinase